MLPQFHTCKMERIMVSISVLLRAFNGWRQARQLQLLGMWSLLLLYSDPSCATRNITNLF